SSTLVGLLLIYEYNKHANSQCIPSSRLISSLLNAIPGISPRFFNQNIAANDPEKKIPSTAANATSLSAKLSLLSIHFNAHSAFFFTHSTLLIALNNVCLSYSSLMYVSIRRL